MSCAYSETYAEYDLEPCTPLGEGVRTARKTHRCDECRVLIIPGERYAWASAVVDGRCATWKRCMECAVEVDRLQTVHKICIPWGLLREFRQENPNS